MNFLRTLAYCYQTFVILFLALWNIIHTTNFFFSPFFRMKQRVSFESQPFGAQCIQSNKQQSMKWLIAKKTSCAELNAGKVFLPEESQRSAARHLWGRRWLTNLRRTPPEPRNPLGGNFLWRRLQDSRCRHQDAFFHSSRLEKNVELF